MTRLDTVRPHTAQPPTTDTATATEGEGRSEATSRGDNEIVTSSSQPVEDTTSQQTAHAFQTSQAEGARTGR